MDFYNSKTSHDIVLVVEQQKFYVDSDKLIKWSNVLKEMIDKRCKKIQKMNKKGKTKQGCFSWIKCFNGYIEDEYTKDIKIPEIELKDVSAKDIRNFLMFINSVSFEITVSNCISLTSVSQFLKAPEVAKICKEFITCNFPILNKLELLDLALNFQLEATKECLKSIRCDCTLCLRDTVVVAFGLPFEHNSAQAMKRKEMCNEFFLQSVLKIFKNI